MFVRHLNLGRGFGTGVSSPVRCGAKHQPKLNLVYFIRKSWYQVAVKLWWQSYGISDGKLCDSICGKCTSKVHFFL